VLEIDPDDAETHYNLGNAYEDKEMFDEAISAYKKTIEFNPEFIDAYLNLGAIYLDKDLADDAISLYKRAVKLAEELGYPVDEEFLDNLKKETR
jgi:tetratricopeptide (TPR) repeat protein